MKLRELLKFNDIAIQCHNYPDADAIASGFGVYEYLRRNGKDPILFYAGPQKAQKANIVIMIENLDIPIRYMTELDHTPELLVTVDCVYKERNIQKFPADNIAVIDHHKFLEECSYMHEIRPDYGSCASIIRQMLLDEGMEINNNEKLATALYYGLYMDTCGFSEIRHAADKDLRDLTKYNEPLITLLKNSNLSSNEMMIAGNALRNCEYNSEYGFAVASTEPCDPNILGFINDLIIQVDSVSSSIVFCPNALGMKISVRSCKNEINAVDLAQFITDGDGGGHILKSGGQISSIILGNTDPLEFITERMVSYNRDSVIMHAGDEHADTTGMHTYIKRDNVLGYVPLTEIVPENTDIVVRALEGDLPLKASEKLFLMVGVAGEVYPIEKDVFEATYIPCDEKPVQNYEYPPSIIDKEKKTFQTLSDSLKGCRAAERSEILAAELTGHIKVFTKWNPSSYFYGEPGDYLAVRKDDDTDFYIIRKDIFPKLYCEL